MDQRWRERTIPMLEGRSEEDLMDGSITAADDADRGRGAAAVAG